MITVFEIRAFVSAAADSQCMGPIQFLKMFTVIGPTPPVHIWLLTSPLPFNLQEGSITNYLSKTDKSLTIPQKHPGCCYLLLTLPASSAECERGFSIMSVVKDGEKLAKTFSKEPHIWRKITERLKSLLKMYRPSYIRITERSNILKWSLILDCTTVFQTGEITCWVWASQTVQMYGPKSGRLWPSASSSGLAPKRRQCISKEDTRTMYQRIKNVCRKCQCGVVL